MPLATEDQTQVHYLRALEDSGAGFAVILADGHIDEANDAFSRLYTGRTAESVRGRRLADILPRSAAEERLSYIRAVHASGKPSILHELWLGVRLTVSMRPIEPGAAYPEGAVMYVIRPNDPLPGSPVDVSIRAYSARFTDMGPLAELSRRELEVLAYIGEGLTNHEIAKRIFRSDKTVEWHRSQLGAKLAAATRVDLAHIAHRAGLSEWLKEQPPLTPSENDAEHAH